MTSRLSAAESLEVRLALAGDLDPFSPVIDVAASTLAAEQTFVAPADIVGPTSIETVAAPAAASVTASPEVSLATVVFVDRSVPDLDSILATAAEIGADTFLLDANRDGLGQIAAALDGRSGIGVIHIFSHGGPGRITLGSTNLTEASLAAEADRLAGLGTALAPDGDILLYGCGVAEGFVGQGFVTALAAATGADIAASDDATGAMVFGGDWDLEQATGVIEAAPLQADLGGNTLSNHVINVGRNAPRLYWQGRAQQQFPSGPFTKYAEPFTSDKVTAHYVKTWAEKTITWREPVAYNFFGIPSRWETRSRTTRQEVYAWSAFNNGSGTRYGTSQFALSAASTYQFVTTASNLSAVIRGEERPWSGNYSQYTVSLYRGSFDPGRPLQNLVAGGTGVTYGGTAYGGFTTALPAGTYVAVTSFDTVLQNSNNDALFAQFNHNAEWMLGTFTLNVTNLNRAPVWGTVANPTVSGAGTRSFSVPWSSVSDPDGDAVTVSAKLSNGNNLPSWLSFNADSLTFSGNPPANTGTLNIRLTANDGQATSDKDFSVTFSSDNDAPVVAAAIPTQSWFGSGGFTFPLPAGTFTDADPSGTTFSYSATLTNGSALPPWLTIDPATGTLSGNPPAGAANLALRVTANDGSGQGNATVSSDFTLRLLNNNDVPSVTATSLTVNEDATLSFIAANFGFTDGDTHDTSNGTTGTGKGLAAIRVVALPGNGTLWLDTNSSGSLDAGEAVAVNQVVVASDLGRLRYTPRADWAGGAAANLSPSADSFSWTATDGVAEAVSPATTSIEVVLQNDPPRLVTSTGRTLVVRPNTGNTLSAVAVDPGISLVDVDAPLTTNAADFDAVLGATITVVDSVSGNFQTGDLLAVTVVGAITSSWNASSGALTLSGTGTAAEYQQVLRSLQFSSSNTSNDNLRTVSITLRTRNVGSVSAAVFDGTDDYIETMRAAIPMGGDWTVSVWALADGSVLNSSQQHTILAQGTSAENFFIQRAYQNNDLRLGDGWTVSGGMPTDGKWHQFTVVKNGTSSTNGTLYIDGVKVATGQLPNALPGTGMRIGQLYKRDNTQEWGGFWKGSISDLRVYNRALNGLEVTSSLDTNTTLTGYESNLVSWYPLDGTADNKAANSWNLGRDFDLRAPQWQQGPWDLGFIDIGSNTNDWTSSPTGDIFRSFSRAGATPTIEVRNSGQVIRAWQNNANVGHFDFLPNTAQNYALTNTGTGGDFTQRPGEVTTLPADYPTAAQYTAPISGIFGVDARFWRAYSTAGDSKFRVFKLSGSTLTEVDAGAQVTGTNPSGGTVSSLRQIVLSQGDKLIFAVHRNGSQAWDETSLSLQVDLLATRVTSGSDTYYYSHSNGHYYHLPSGTANWDTAKSNAEALTVAGQSGYLATPTDSASMQIVRAILREANVGNAWAGARQINSTNEPTGSFYWATGPKAGQPFNGTWNGGEPNNGQGGTEHHVDITQNNYNDNNGATSLRYVVEFGDGRLPLPVELTGTIAVSRDPGNAMLFKDAGVAYSARTRHYYRVDATARTWTDAVTNAASTTYEGQTGYLARVTDLNELRIAGWFNRLRNQADQWVGLQQTNTSVEPAGGWQWVTGDQAGMTTDANFSGTSTFWSPGEPNNGSGATEHYGGLNNYGFALNDFKNDQPNVGSLIEYGIDGTSLAIPLFAAPATLPDKTVSGSRNIAVRVGNTAPSVTNWPATTSEDTTLAFAASDFTSRFTDPELDSLASITLTAIPAAAAGVLRLGGTTLAVNAVVAAGDLARLQFIPVANSNGTATFSYTATDGNLSSGSAATVTITVVAINDPPLLDTAPVVIVTGIAEDVADGSNSGMTVAALVADGSITDVDGSPVEAIAVTLVDNTYGEWQYRIGSGTWTTFTATRGVVRLGGSSRLLDGTDTIRFVPDTNFSGTATISYRAWDKSTGTAGGTTDPLASGGNTAVSAAEETATITVAPVNDAPTTAGKTITLAEDSTYTFTVADFAFADVDTGNTLQSITITTLPTVGSLTLANVAVTLNQQILLAGITAGSLKFTPIADAFGTGYATLGFTVSDGSASSTAATITFDVTDTNDAPTAVAWATGGSVAENSAAGTVVGTLSATDPNTGDVLRFRRVTNANFTVDPDGTVKVAANATIDYEASATQTLGVEVTDSGGLTYVQNLTVTLTDVTETDPAIFANPGYVAPGATITITTALLRATDAQQTAAQLVFTVLEAPTGGVFWIDADSSGTLNAAERPLAFRSDANPDAVDTFTQADIAAGKLKFTKDATQSSGQLRVRVSDGTGGATPEARLILVPASPPVVTAVDDQQWSTTGSQSFRLPAGTFTDPDQDELTVSATLVGGQPLPGWLAFDPATWTFSGTPSGQADGSSLAIRVSATDGRTAAVSDDFTITFSASVTAPSVTNPIANQVFDGAGAKSFTVPANTFTDPNAAPLNYAATLASGAALPSWLSFDAGTRTFSGNPPASAVPGPLMLKVTATSSGGSASSFFRLDIRNANDVPSESPAGAVPDVTLSGVGTQSFTVGRTAFADADGGTLSLSAIPAAGGDLPSWLAFSFDPTTGIGTFNADLPSASGSLVVRLIAEDGAGGTGFADFTITYSGGANAAPQVRTSAGTMAMDYSPFLGRSVISTAPVGSLSAFVLGQGTTRKITTDHLLEADTDDDGTGLTFTVTTPSTRGQLWLDLDSSGTINGSEAALGAGGTFTQADIDAGRLTYRHTAGDDTDDSFVFSLADGGENGVAALTGTDAAGNPGVVFAIGVAAASAGGGPVLQSVSRATGAEAVTNADTLVFRVVFSQNVSGVGTADFALTGTAAAAGTILSVQAIDAATYDVTVGGIALATAEGTVGLGLASSPTIVNTAGTAIDASVAPTSTASYTLDNTAPTATVTAAVVGHDGVTPFTVTVAFLENVNALSIAGFTASNATLSNFVQLSSGGSPTNSYSLTVTPTAAAAITISLAAGATTDDAGNANAAASLTVQPGPTITGPGSATGSTSSTSVAENTTSVFTFTANASVTWSIAGGADAGRFSIHQTTGALTFSPSPDFEAPADANTDNAYVVIVRATDGASMSTDQTVTVTVTNANEGPTITIGAGDSASASLTEANAALTASGTLSVADPDLTDVVTVAVPAVVASGTTTGLAANNAALLAMFTVNTPNTVITGPATTGTITWAFNSGSETFDYVAAGETLTLTYTVRVTDSASVTTDRLVTVTITGTQDLPVLAVATGSTATGSATETDTTLTASGVLTTTDLDLSNTVTPSVHAVAVTGGTFTGSVPLTSAELQAMLTLQPVQGGGSIGTSSGTGIPNLDNQQGGLYVNTTPPGTTGVVAQWRFFKPQPPPNDARYNNTWVTPVILEKVGSNYVMRGVGRSRLTTTHGTFTFDFELVSGSAQLVNANYTYGHIDRNINNPNAVLDTRSVGSVGWSTPNGATWGYLQAGLSSANIGTTYTQISNAGRLYASELILARPAAVAADPTAGDDLAWNFASGSSGNGAFNFLPAGRTLELSYTARATDSSTPAGSTDRAIVLTLTGTNDAPTDIALLAAVVAENAASGTAVGSFSTSDVDVGDTFTYSLVSGTGDTDNAAFQIVGGQLRTNASFDFETKSSYSIRVRSTDQSNAAFEKQFTISVTDVNEAPTAVALTNMTTSLAENTSTATRTKVADIVVTDDALGSETITLTGADAASFEIDGLALYLKSGVTLDVEAKSSYAVTVNVEDTSLTGSTPVTVGFTLTVTDVNEAPTAVALTNMTTSLAENTSTATRTKVADIVVTDDALGSETITLTGADAASFEIDGLALYLKSGVTLDVEAKSSYAVTVNVEDTSLTGSTPVTAAFTLTVTDVNEAPTAVALANTTTSIAENASTATRIKVADIVVTDDALGSETITLTGVDAASFEVDGLALYLKSGVSLDRETKASYAVTVNVADTSLTGSTPVTVSFTLTVTDVNEAPTGVALTNTTTSILENTSTATRIKVADIVVTDDALGSETITLSGTDAASFEVDGLALYLKSGVTLNFEAKSSYAVTVNVADGSLTGSTPVTVGFTLTVTDVNEAPAAVALTNTTTSILENTSTATRTKVADIVVTDDALGSETITLSGTDAASFEVDGLALYLKSGVTLDREAKSSYAVTVNVADTALSGSTPVTAAFTLTVTDVNEAPTILVAGGDSAGANLAETNAGLSATGTLSVADGDGVGTLAVSVAAVTASGATAGLTAGDAALRAMFAVNSSGLVGSISTTGTIAWAFSSGSEAFDFLAAGESLVLTYLVRTVDAANLTAEQAVAITITGTNDAPQVAAAALAYADTAAADAFATVTGTLAASDPDRGATRTFGIQGGSTALGVATRAGRFGTLSVKSATGEYAYRPDPRAINAAAADATDAFTITADDGAAIGTAAFVVSLTGTPDTPTVLSVSEDTGASTSDRLTNRNVVTVMGSADPLITVVVRDTVAGVTSVVGTAIASAEGLFTVVTAPLADGGHALAIVSEAGGRSAGPVTLGEWRIDTVAPAAPAITTPDTSGGLVSGTAEPDSTVTVTVAPQGGFAGGTYAVTAGADGTWAFDAASMPPVRGAAVPVPGGPFTFSATARDRAGNTSPASAAESVRFDTSAPRITSPSVTALLRPMIAGTAPARQTLRITIDGVVAGETIASREGAWSFTVPADLAAGTRAVRVAVVAGGSERGVALQSLLVDRTPPAIPTIMSAARFATARPTISGTAPEGTTVALAIRRAGQAPVTVYTAPVGADGTWSVELGRMTPASGVLTTLADGDYDLSATAANAAGLVSAATTGRLSIDTTVPARPGVGSSGTSASGTPVISGSAEPGSTVRVVIGEAVFEAPVGADGTWSIDLATATTLAGTRITLPGGIHELRLVAIDPSGNASPEAMQLLRVAAPVANEPPAVLASANSFSGTLTAQDVAEGVTSVFALAGVADGAPATLEFADRTYTTAVTDSAAAFTIPQADLAALPQGTVAFTFSVGPVGISFSGSFVVDTVGPGRPTFGGITSTPDDKTPADQFTLVRRPTVVIRGEPGQTVVLRGPEGVVDPSRYSVVEAPAGTYTITLLDELATGDYSGMLADVHGNENPNRGGTPAQNFFRIDSVPILYDRPESRQAGEGRVYGVLGILNRLDGAEFPVAANADGTWTDLDGERLTMGVVGGASRTADGRVVETTITLAGATLSVLADTGSYVYTPAPGTTRIDRFPLYLRDASGNQTQFVLSFDTRDFLDRDGITESVETQLAGGSGDRNADGVADARQNSVTTLAWGTAENFTTATDPASTAPVDRRTISTVVVNTRPLHGGTGRNFTSLAGLMADVDPLAQLLDIGVVAPSAMAGSGATAAEFTTGRWDAMNYTVEALASRGLLDLVPGRAGTQIQVSFDVSAAGISTRGGTNGSSGFNAARKFVSAATIEAYAAAGLPLVDLDGNAVTAPGWLDFTARDTTGDGIPDTDGVIFVDFQQPGEAGHGTVDAVVVNLTDNAFGDDDPTLERVVDPFLAGAANNRPRMAPASARYVNTPANDSFSPAIGRLAAADADGDRLTYGIVGGRVQKGVAIKASPLGTLRVNVATGAYTYAPTRRAMNAARPDTIDEFVTTVSDGSATTQASFRVQVAAAGTAVPATFRLGSLAPENPATVMTRLPAQPGRRQIPRVNSPQHFVEFTLAGTGADIQSSDLRLSVNGRQVSLASARLEKVAEAAGLTTYRLLGIDAVTAARGTYAFGVTSAAGEAATAWRNGLMWIKSN